MVLVAAGSLCAGKRELPIGSFRQYNIIEISNNYNSARIHVREMSISTTFCPSKSLPSESGSFLDMEWTPVKNIMGQPIEIKKDNYEKQLMRAEKKFKINDYKSVIDLLMQFGENQQQLGRKLLLESLNKMERWTDIISQFQNPGSIDELYMVVTAMIKQKKYSDAEDYLQKWASKLGLPEAQYEDFVNRIRIHENYNCGSEKR